ncbi:MAG: hypothetical protein WCG91_03545 [Candidatus Shapirobacteria bacterium]
MINLIAPIYAATGDISIAPVGQFAPLKNLTPASIVSGGVSLVLIVVSLVFFFILVLGGLKWITSGGDEKAVAAARAQITNALIGLAIIFAAWAIINLIGTVFGINILSLKVPTFQ